MNRQALGILLAGIFAERAGTREDLNASLTAAARSLVSDWVLRERPLSVHYDAVPLQYTPPASSVQPRELYEDHDLLDCQGGAAAVVVALLFWA